MSGLRADIIPGGPDRAYDPSPMRRPPLTPQYKWGEKYITDMRHLPITHLLGFSKFKIMSRYRRGPAEVLRLLFTYAGIPFENPTLRAVDWKCLMDKVPYGNLPALWIDHNIYGEIHVVTRHIARSMGMLGATEAETLVVEAVLEQVRKLRESEILQKAFEELQERVDDNFEQAFTVILPQHFAFWEKHITDGCGPFIVASGMSVADIAIFDFVYQYRVYLPIDNVLVNFRHLQALLNAVRTNQRLAVYIKSVFAGVR
ncbi:glutathione S-transferase [Elysia marginata]|uniref:Glutathione S-transferase n=1 Tax=Elysia marginata TaxID=1093978 RepID=A0AAV4K145_9GAST|nr:glutathione S-transferase [Elysia marginata]